MFDFMTGDNVMSPNAFKWFITLLTGVVAGLWALYDIRNLIKIRGADRRDPLVHDKVFGYYMGIVIGVGGVVGVLRFHDVL